MHFAKQGVLCMGLFPSNIHETKDVGNHQSLIELTCQSNNHIIQLMEIKELTQHMHRFVESKGWYEQINSRPQTLKN